MARVTVEDCVEVVANRFELVQLASQRARDIASGARLTIDRDNDKDSVVSLREIAEKTVNVENLREEVIKGFQKALNTDIIEEQDAASDAAEFISPDQIAAEMKALQVNDISEDDIVEASEFTGENLDVDD